MISQQLWDNQEHPATPLNATESVAEETAEVKEYMCVICDQTFSTEERILHVISIRLDNF